MDKEFFKYKTEYLTECRHHNIQWLSNYNYDKRGSIVESYGILNSFNQDFSKLLVAFVNNEILPVFSADDTTEPDTIIADISDVPLFKRFVLPLPFDWTNEVHIYVTTSFGDVGALLSKTNILNYDITYDGKTEPSYKLNGSHIEYFSIILSSDLKNTDKYYIVGIIKHEMKHAYDIIRKNFMADELNRDIKYFYDTLETDNIKFLTNYYAYSKEDIKTFICRLNVSEVFSLFRDMIYYLNSSEMSARLVNFDSDVDNLLKNQNSDEFGNTSIGIYLGLKNIMQGLNQYITPQDKKTFSEQHMIEFNKVYGNSDNPRLFKHYGKFDERSFNYLTAFFLKKINTFIYKCHSIYTSKCEGHMPLSTLS